jgi:hypothetical protein
MDRRNRGACQRLGQHTYIHTVNNCELRCYILYRGLYYYMCIALCVRALCSTQTLSSISCDIIIYFTHFYLFVLLLNIKVSRTLMLCVSLFVIFIRALFSVVCSLFVTGNIYIYFFCDWIWWRWISGDWEIARAIGIYYIILYHRPSAAAL